MSTQLQVFTNDQIDVIYKATHLTETLNKKLATALPAGIYQGFNLVYNGTNDLVGVDPDAGATGHVAVIENDTDRSITVRNAGGSFTLDLETLRDAVTTKKYAIAIWGQYSRGSNTGAAIRAYETYPTNELLTAPEASTLVIMGEVEVAAGGAPALIPAEAITQARRMSAWQNLAPEHGLWKPLLYNSSFEIANDTLLVANTISGWEQSWSGCGVGGSVLDARSGSRCIFVTAFASSGVTFGLTQQVGEPVSHEDRFRVRGFFKALQVPSAGGVECELSFAGSNGGPLTPIAVPVTINGVSADWEEFGAIVSPPAGATALISVTLQTSASLSGTITPIFYFDDLQVWKSWSGADRQEAARLGYRADASIRRVWFPELTYGDSSAPYLQRSASDLLSRPTLDLIQSNFRARNSLGVGDDLVQSLSEAAITRLALPHRATNATVDGDTLTLLLESLPDTGTEASVRYYSDDVGNLIFTHNAKYTALDTWTRDDSDFEAIRVQISAKDGLEVSFREADTTATFTSSEWRSHLSQLRTHVLAETTWIDFASLHEINDSSLIETSPYTGTLDGSGGSGDGTTGWVRVGGFSGEGSSFGSFGPGVLVHCETAGRQGWYVVKDLGGTQGDMQVQLADIETYTAVNFGAVGTITLRFYHGVFIGTPRGPVFVESDGPKGIVIDAPYPGDLDAIQVRDNGTNASLLFRVQGSSVYAGRIIPTGFQPIQLSSMMPHNNDWNLSTPVSSTMAWESVGTGDYLIGTFPYVGNGVTITDLNVVVDPGAAGTMTLTVRDYSGSSLGTDTSSGSGYQTLSISGLTLSPWYYQPGRWYITSGQSSDRVIAAYCQFEQ